MREIGVARGFDSAREIELSRALVGDRLTMCETVVVCRTDRRFVEMFSVEHPAFDARDFRADERGFGFEICGAMPCPYLELSVMVVKSGKMLLSLFGGS